MPKVEFIMPRLGESITEAAIIKWWKEVGDTIEVDDILLEVATDKVDSEVPATVSGTIVELLYEPNEVVTIGEPIAIIDSDGSVPVTKPAKRKEPVASVKESTTQTKKSAKGKVQATAFQVNKNVWKNPI